MNNQFVLYLQELAGTAAGAPEWIRLLPLGKVELMDGRPPLEVDQASLGAMIAAWRDRGIDLVMDYEHQTLSGDKAPAAGWIKELESRADGLWARVEWTPAALEHLANKEYRYFSPVLRLESKSRKPLALLHVALTNTPAIKDLPPLVAKNLEALVANQDAQAVQEARAKEVGIKISANKEAAKIMLKELIKRLAMKPEATEEEVLALMDQRFTQSAELAAALPEIAQAAGLKAEATVSEIKGTILALKEGAGELTELKAKVTALETESLRAKAEAAVAQAIKDKKITPGEREFNLKYAMQDLEQFNAHMAAKVPIISDNLKILQGGPGDAGGLTPDDLNVCKQLNITPEAFKATQSSLAAQAH